MSIKVAQIKFRQELQSIHDNRIASMRREWKSKEGEFLTAKAGVESKYDLLISKVEAISISLQTKTVRTRSQIKSIQTEIAAIEQITSNLMKSPSKLNEPSEIELEASLSTEKELISSHLSALHAQISSVVQRRDEYESKYIKVLKEQKRLQTLHDSLKAAGKARLKLADGLMEFSKNLKEESCGFDKMLELLKEMREQKVVQAPNVERYYNDIIRSAGQIPNPTPRCYEGIVIESPIGQKSNDISNSASDPRIQAMEENIKVLLSTGNYSENDKIISQMRKQVLDLSSEVKRIC